MSTFREKYNIKYGFRKNASHSIDDIAKTTKIKKSILQQAFNRGVGAAKTNPQSVRNRMTGKKQAGGFSPAKRMSNEQWGFGRLYGFVMKNPKQVGNNKPDNDLFLKIKK
tara:strand:- start:1684 stop:2013 length:330 start_codon:yes stop_codon:yes gene_type:complete